MDNLKDEIPRYGILWDIKPYGESSELSQGITGESIGLAAYIGIYFTLRDKYPDQRAIYSAKLVETEDNKLQLGKVNSIPAKIRAAININKKALKDNPQAIPPFDGFGIHKSNWNEELLDIIRNEQFQISVLDDFGSEINTYPERSETAKNNAS